MPYLSWAPHDRTQYKGKEFYELIKHFQDKASVDINHYFVVDLFEDVSPRNIFWTDGRSRDSNMKFGDVFDVTYMTNKFKMSFTPFIEVNHHGQLILFEGALLENEKEETFFFIQQLGLCPYTHAPAVSGHPIGQHRLTRGDPAQPQWTELAQARLSPTYGRTRMP